jgi:type IV secretion system protein TrbI
MSDANPPPPGMPQIQDKRLKPAGLLPRNAQAWVLIGVATLMILILAFSGRNAPKAKHPESPAQGLNIVEPNGAQIEDYQDRLATQTRKLQVEQAELAQTQQALRGASAAPTAAPSADTTGSLSGSRYSSEFDGTESSIESEMKKREFQSRFSSNVALSYRTETMPGVNPLALPSAVQASPAYALSAPMPITAPAALGQPPPLITSLAPPTAGIARDERSEVRPATIPPVEDARTAKTRQRDADLDQADAKRYRLFEGTVLETVLTNRLDGSFSGPVNCMVTANVYSHNGLHLLIPQGSRVLGEVRKVETFGEQRLAVTFHRLIMPDGYSLSLDKEQGLSQMGETGLQDQVNHHYLQVFGVSLAIGAIAGLSQANTNYGLNESAADAYRQGVASSLSQSSLHILDRYLNVLPTFTIREGQRVKIYLSDDLLVPAYDQHQMPEDL